MSHTYRHELAVRSDLPTHDSGGDSITTIEVSSEDVGRKGRRIVIENFQSWQTRSMKGNAGPKCVRLAVSVAVEQPVQTVGEGNGGWLWGQLTNDDSPSAMG
jgi:hypothetical protein